MYQLGISKEREVKDFLNYFFMLKQMLLEFCTVTSSASSQSSKTSEIGQSEKHGDLLKPSIEYKQKYNYRVSQLLCYYEYNAPRVDYYQLRKQMHKEIFIHVNN